MSVKWKFKSLMILALLSAQMADADELKELFVHKQDTSKTDTVPELRAVYRFDQANNKVGSIKNLSLITAHSLPQLIKGELPGVYVSESNGEPGTSQRMFVRGLNKPIFTNRDIYSTQPLIVLDGVPQIGEHPFSFDIQNYDVERIGPENNLLTTFDIDNIESIVVHKDLSTLAKYGPLGVNGVIEITSKKSLGPDKKRISVNSYGGFSARPSVTTINGSYENAFRKQFYDLYTTNGRYNEDDVYPIYLSDSLNNNYFGPSNWSDSYYQNGYNYGANATVAGGGNRSNFQFNLGTIQNGGTAEDTEFDKLNARFYLNLRPFNWLVFETLVNVNRLNRDRNKNLRNRYAMMGYFPDLGAPISPNKEVYDKYLDEFDKSFDNNFNNLLGGFFGLQFNVDRLRFKTKFGIDYNEGYRDLFYPSTILESNNFASNYYGYNQRILIDNTLVYDFENDANYFYFEAGNSFTWDVFKYNYAYAFKGVNDYIKINLLGGDQNSSVFPKQLIYKFLDRTRHNMISVYGKGSYTYDNTYTASLMLRYDGSSNAQPTARWFFSPTLSLGWNAKNSLMADNDQISQLNFRASVGRLGIYNMYDNYSQGPSYTAQIGYTGNMIVPSYNAFAALVRPYEVGWVGYDIPWSYMDEVNIGMDLGFQQNKLQFSLDAYVRDTKDQLVMLPGKREFGYKYQYESGLDVRNMGVDLGISGDIISKSQLSWNSGIILGFNTNRILALPNGLDEVAVDNRLLKVGERVDAFWLLENEGIYLTDNDVPQQSGQLLTYRAIDLKAGDPIWKDQNGDFNIDDEDRIVKGNIIPKVSGSWNNSLRYNNFDLNLNFYFNLGRSIMNQEMSNRFNFIENENAREIDAIKEITYWEKRGDYSKYPLYNPWSSVSPYQVNQSLFLENGSFVKLRTVSLGYNMKDVLSSKYSKKMDLYVYLSANNLLTLSPYSGRDPELVNYLGYDLGYSLPLPKTFALGFKLNL